MLSKIPSWAVAVTGGAIVIAATATSTMLLHQARLDITAVKSEIAETRNAVDRLWDSHLQADHRSTAADVFFARALESDTSQKVRSFLFKQAAEHLRGAVLSMWAASGEPVPDKSPETIAAAEQLLREGNTDGYVSLKSEINRLRLLSQTHINGRTADVRAAESRVEALQARESHVYLAYVFFNLLGLMVTMCKDLPVWKAERPGKREVK